MNPARILVQRVLVDILPADQRELRELLEEPAEQNAGLLQTFDVRIGLACADDADEHLPAPDVLGLPGLPTRDAIKRIARHHYGWPGWEAAREILAMLAHRRHETVGERGVW